MKKLLFLTIISVLFLSCQENNQSKFGTICKNAMVVSADSLASKVGLEILQKGGNAFDAAIAIQFVLAVTYPRAGNIGGGGFMVFHQKNGNFGSLDFREKAPKLAFENMYLDDSLNIISRLSLDGNLAVGVPGTVDGMFKIYEKFGTLPFELLINPAIELAEIGFKITKSEAKRLNQYQANFIRLNAHNNVFIKNKPWKKADKIIQKDLAETLKRIRKDKRNGFYKGKTAELIMAQMKASNGIISYEDLENYSAKWRDPLKGNYKDFEIISMGPPSSGGLALLQLLKGSEQFNFKKLGFNSAERIHLMTELQRRVYADRASHLGDLDFYDVPIKMLLDEDYLNERFSNINKSKKTDSQAIKAGKVDLIESFETTHFSILDSMGNAVVITTTLNSSYGSKVVVGGAGFFLNNEMDDFSIKPGSPNQFGLVGAEANKIEPEKRMLSSMTPTLVLKNGKIKMLIGTPGGSTIITSVYQTIINVVDFKMSMKEAIQAPKTHSQWLPDRIYYEKHLDKKLVLELQNQYKHEMVSKKLGRLQNILIHENGKIEGATDPKKGEGLAIGF